MDKNERRVTDVLATSAKLGFVDGNFYDNNRPDYTDEATDKVIDLLEIPSTFDHKKSFNVVELGSGTGKFTGKVKTKLPKNVDFLATEPSDDFFTTLKEKHSTVKTLQCAAEHLPFSDESVHGVIAAQCFHWFANKNALDEIFRVLKEDGNIVLIWNTKDRNVDWVDKIIKTYSEYCTDEPIYYEYKWKTVIDNYSGFRLVEQLKLPGQVFKGNIDSIVYHFSSISTIQKLEKNQKAQVMSDIHEILSTHQDTKDKDIIDLPLFTDIFHYKKIGR